MSQTAKQLEPGFSVADAGYPTFSLRDDVLLLEFADWQERLIRVRFENAAGVKWQEAELPSPGDRNDVTYEIIESEWLAEYLADGARGAADQLRHFRLHFNACGVLDVLASSLKLENSR